MIVLLMKANHLRSMQVATVEVFEFADKQDAKTIVEAWRDKGVMYTVKSSILMDYAFLICYVLLMINCSNHQMNVERDLVLNNLLRLNIPLAVGTGILDVAENSIMLNNIRSLDDFFPTAMISTVKFVLAGWIFVVWIVSVVKRRFVR